MTRSLNLNPGDLRHQVTFLAQAPVADISGTATLWLPTITTRAAIEPVRGTDLLRAGQDISQVFISVKVRWQPGIDATLRLSTSTGTYTIQSVENILERNRVLILTCLALRDAA